MTTNETKGNETMTTEVRKQSPLARWIGRIEMELESLKPEGRVAAIDMAFTPPPVDDVSRVGAEIRRILAKFEGADLALVAAWLKKRADEAEKATKE